MGTQRLGITKALGARTTVGKFTDIRRLARIQDRPIVDALRKLIYSVHSDPHELVWPKQKIISFGVGPKKMSQHYVYIGVQPAHINLGFYQGSALKDPEGMLEGTSTSLRHVKVVSIADVAAPGLATLVRAAKRAVLALAPPSPGKAVMRRDLSRIRKISYASTELVELHRSIAKDFMAQIFELEPCDYAISDESEVVDFMSMNIRDESPIWSRIKRCYGIEKSDIGSGRLVKLFAEIARRKSLQ
jgi:hypothetical protein